MLAASASDRPVFHSKALVLLLEERGLKPAEFSRLSGIPKNSLSCYLKGEKIPQEDRILHIANTLGVPVSALSALSHKEASATYEELLSLKETAQLLNCSIEKVKTGIINNQWNPPIGSAISNGTKYSFHIPKKRVEIYLGLAVQSLSTSLVEHALSLQKLIPQEVLNNA